MVEACGWTDHKSEDVDHNFVKLFNNFFPGYMVTIYNDFTEWKSTIYITPRSVKNNEKRISIFYDVERKYYFCLSNVAKFFDFPKQCKLCDYLFKTSHNNCPYKGFSKRKSFQSVTDEQEHQEDDHVFEEMDQGVVPDVQEQVQNGKEQQNEQENQENDQKEVADVQEEVKIEQEQQNEQAQQRNEQVQQQSEQDIKVEVTEDVDQMMDQDEESEDCEDEDGDPTYKDITDSDDSDEGSGNKRANQNLVYNPAKKS